MVRVLVLGMATAAEVKVCAFRAVKTELVNGKVAAAGVAGVDNARPFLLALPALDATHCTVHAARCSTCRICCKVTADLFPRTRPGASSRIGRPPKSANRTSPSRKSPRPAATRYCVAQAKHRAGHPPTSPVLTNQVMSHVTRHSRACAHGTNGYGHDRNWPCGDDSGALHALACAACAARCNFIVHTAVASHPPCAVRWLARCHLRVFSRYRTNAPPATYPVGWP